MLAGIFAFASGAKGILSSPVTKYALLATVAVAFVAYQRHDAANDATAKALLECKTSVELATEKETSRQEGVVETVLEDQLKRAKLAAEEAKGRENEARKLLKDLTEKTAGCVLSDDDIERLRKL